jgi:hypothetical protein
MILTERITRIGADIDRSGTITEDEFVSFARLMKAMADSRNTDSSQINEIVVEYIFRIFDEDNNGQIEADEFESCFSSWIQSIYELFEVLLNLAEMFLFENVISDVVSAIEGSEDFPRDYAGNIIVDDILHRVAAEAPDNGPATPNYEHIPWIKPKIRSAYLMLSALQKKMCGLDSDELSELQFTNVLTPVLCDIFEIFLSLSPSIKKEISDDLNASFESAHKVEIPPHLLHDLICSPVDSLRAFLRNGGLDQVLERLFGVLDACDEGGLSSSQLASALELFFEVRKLPPTRCEGGDIIFQGSVR